MNLAGSLSQLGLRVLVVDMDKQRNSYLWYVNSQSNPAPIGFEVVSWSQFKEDFLDHLAPRLEEFDVVFVDCPPAMESIIPWTSLLACDFALIPVVPDHLNLWGAKDAENLVFEARSERKKLGLPSDLPAAFLFSSVAKGVVAETCQQTLKAAATIPIFKSKISRKNSYLNGPVFGTTTRLFRKNGASEEVCALAMELAKELKIKIKKQK